MRAYDAVIQHRRTVLISIIILPCTAPSQVSGRGFSLKDPAAARLCETSVLRHRHIVALVIIGFIQPALCAIFD